VRGGGEPGHVQSDLRDNHGGGGVSEAGDVIESPQGLGERGDHLLDGRFQVGDIGAEPIDTGKHLGQQHGVVVGEEPGERLAQLT
jgi:hypothetical protein